MEATTRRRPIGDLARFLNRHRRASAGVALAVLAVVPWAWWATQLWGLPDIGDPFDVAAFEAERVPDESNAFHWYRDAASWSSRISRAFWARPENNEAARKYEAEWSKAAQPWRDLLAQSGEALAIWRAGSEKSDAKYDHPEGISYRTLLPITQELRSLNRLAILEGSRLESEGDMAGAWGWYRAALRASRHSGRHGFQVERLVGAANHDDASKALTRWASDPRVDAPMLRRALDEVIAADAMTAPRSEALKMHYLVLVRAFDDPNLLDDLWMFTDPGDPPDWCLDLPVSNKVKKPILAARILVADDRERSLRVARLMTASWLVEFGKLPNRRSKVFRNDPTIFEADPTAPPASRALPPEKLAKWLDSSLLASRFFRALGKYGIAIDRERGRQARLVVHLASELYRREHQGTPPPSPRALVGPYLKALPEALEP